MEYSEVDNGETVKVGIRDFKAMKNAIYHREKRYLQLAVLSAFCTDRQPSVLLLEIAVLRLMVDRESSSISNILVEEVVETELSYL